MKRLLAPLLALLPLAAGCASAPAPAAPAAADRFPAQVRRGYYGGGLAPPEGMEETYRESYRRLIEMVGKLYREGVPLVAGTDDLADLIVVDGNPTEHISDIRKVELTIKDGVLFDTAKLYEAVGIRP